MKISIRHATQNDLPEVLDFSQSLIGQHHAFDERRYAVWSREHMELFFREQIAKENTIILVAIKEDKVSGYALLRFEESDTVSLLEPALWLHDIYVDENARGLSVGSSLIGEAKKIARERKMPLMLSVAAQNQTAQSIFAAHGFRPCLQEMRLDYET